jgi:hypothetical protein
MSGAETFTVRRRQQHRGMALAVTLLALLILFVVGTSVATICAQIFTLQSSDYQSEQARYGAEAGLAAALSQLMYNPNWTSGFSDPQPLVFNPQVSYTVDVWNNLNAGTAMQTPDGTTVPPGMVYMISTGQVAGRWQKAARAMYGPGFNYTAFGVNGISLDNNSVVKADVTGSPGEWWFFNADFPWQPPIPGWGGNQGNQATASITVGTQSTANGAIRLDNDSVVQGDVLVPLGANPNAVVSLSNGSSVAGVMRSSTVTPAALDIMGQPQSSKDTQASGGVLQPGTYNNLTVKQSVQMTPGVYIVNGNLRLVNGATVQVQQPGVVRMYVSGSFTASNGATITSGPPNSGPAWFGPGQPPAPVPPYPGFPPGFPFGPGGGPGGLHQPQDPPHHGHGGPPPPPPDWQGKGGPPPPQGSTVAVAPTFQLYVTGNQSINITNNSTVFMSVFAPQSTFSLTNGSTLNGNVVANHVSLSTSTINGIQGAGQPLSRRYCLY